jgi:uncharacterized membrane protein
MRRFCLLSVVFSVALMSCTTSEPTPLAKDSAAPSAPSTASPLAIPSPTVPFVRCDTSDLEMQLIGEGAAAGSVKATIEVRNKSSRDCDLYGYAGIQLLNAFRQPLPTKVIWSTNAFFLTTPAATEVVGLPAGTQLMTPDRPVPGHAYIPLSFNDVQEPCSEAALLKVTPPDASNSLVIGAAPTGVYLLVCSGGTLVVNPIRAAIAR